MTSTHNAKAESPSMLSTQRAYCTFFDIGYLSRGITMIESLRLNGDNSRVYILALDDMTKDYFAKYPLDNVHIVDMLQVEEFAPELLQVRNSRSRMEYYFTTTPQLFRYLFHLEGIPDQVITYLDADLYFYKSPDAILNALGSGSVGITEHRYADHLQKKLSQYGRFNAGFVCFRNDQLGISALNWWAARALEWCSDIPTEGKYANQGYLDTFPEFSGVTVLKDDGLNLAPWNTARHNVTITSTGVVLADRDPLVFFHFHGVRTVGSWFVTSQLIYGSRLTPAIKKGIYQPYVNHLSSIEEKLLSQKAPKPVIKKRGNGLHGVLARTWKFGMDRISIVTGNALKTSH